MLKKLLWKHHNKLQLAGAVAGSIIGMFLLLLSAQMYLDVNHIIEESPSLVSPNYIIINKSVTVLNTLDESAGDFSEKEIEHIKKQPFINDAAPFIYNDFRIRMYSKLSADAPTLSTAMYYEAIPDRFLDIKDEAWFWDEDSNYIPMIMPGDFLNLYNLGFAPARSLPQISKKTLQLFSFEVIIYNNIERKEFVSKIAGVSDRINTILVPLEFMKWANKEFGKGKEIRPKRVILAVNDPADPAFVKFLSDKGYETNKEKLKTGKLNTLLRIILAAVAVIGVVIIILSLLVFVLNFQLLISRSAGEIRLLLELGFKYTTISFYYIVYLIAILIIVTAVNLAALILSKAQIFEWFTENGFEIPEGISLEIYLSVAGLFLLLAVINTANIFKSVTGLSKKS